MADFDINRFDQFQNTDTHVYVYLRVSTLMQSTDGQLKEVYEWCEKNRLYPPAKNIYIDEGISGKVEISKRKIGIIAEMSKKGDIIIVPEMSRLGRTMSEVNSLLHDLVTKKKVVIYDIKNNLKLDGSFQSSIMAMLFSMCAEMERTLISERVKKGMARDKVKENLKKRKPRTKNKLDGKEDDIKKMLDEGKSKPEISKLMGCHNAQLHKFCRIKNL